LPVAQTQQRTAKGAVSSNIPQSSKVPEFQIFKVPRNDILVNTLLGFSLFRLRLLLRSYHLWRQLLVTSGGTVDETVPQEICHIC
jgi:hypothetical protein